MRLYPQIVARAALIVGLMFVLLVWIPGAPVRPDQFALPKELALATIGMVCAGFLMIEKGEWIDVRLDAPLVAALAWGAILAGTVSRNADAGWRLVGVFSAGFALFLSVRQAARGPGRDAMHAALCVVLALVAGAILLEAYGAIPFVSEPGRRPGGPLGNRNVAARVLCLGLPLFWRQLFLTEVRTARCVVACTTTAAIAAIVLSRSRGSWLAAIALVTALPLASRVLCLGRTVEHRRLVTHWWAAAVLAGALLAVVLPNRLDWQPADFGSSAGAAFDFQGGTGRGRLIQAQTTWRMIRASPMVGVGPGNWSIVYPVFARVGDPSYTPDALYPAPAVPRGDLLSLTAEFGIPGLAFAVVCLGMALARTARMSRSPLLSVRLSALMLLATGGTAILLGMLDPVLRLAPSLSLVAVLSGLGFADGTDVHARRAIGGASRRVAHAALTACAAACAYAATSALRDLAAVRSLKSMSGFDDVLRAVAVAPRNYEARMVAAYLLVRASRCDLAAPHLTVAHELQPYARSVSHLRGQCSRHMP